MTASKPQDTCDICPWRNENAQNAVAGDGPPAFALVPDPEHDARLALAKIVLLSFTLIALVCIGGVMAGRLPDGTVLQVLGIFGVAVAAIGYFYFKYDSR